jgi:hypothetical protein
VRSADFRFWRHLSDIASPRCRCRLVGSKQTLRWVLSIATERHRQRRAAHPIPACRIVAVTLPPALDSAFMVSRIAETWLNDLGRTAGGEGGDGARLPSSLINV